MRAASRISPAKNVGHAWTGKYFTRFPKHWKLACGLLAVTNSLGACGSGCPNGAVAAGANCRELSADAGQSFTKQSAAGQGVAGATERAGAGVNGPSLTAGSAGTDAEETVGGAGASATFTESAGAMSVPAQDAGHASTQADAPSDSPIAPAGGGGSEAGSGGTIAPAKDDVCRQLRSATSACEDAVMHHCGAAGTTDTTETCANARLCQLGVNDNRCQRPCVANSFMCIADRIWTCSADLVLEQGVLCGAGLCDAQRGQCTSCKPNSPGCDAPQVSAAQPSRVIYASPDGSGTSCTEADPCTIEQAKLAAAAATEAATDDVVVELADGVYRLRAPLHFGAADSGKNGHTVVWRARAGTAPVISGALQVTGWKRPADTSKIWRAVVPSALRTRQLYVDGHRAPIAQGAPPVALHGNATGYVADDDSYAKWRNPSALEFVYPGGSGAWTEPRCRVGAVQATQITMTQPCWNNTTNRPHLAMPAVELPSMSPSTAPSRIENAYELMKPGQWYLDSAESALYVWPLPGQTLTRVEVPVLEQLLVGDGSLDEPVHDISFTGFEFAYATWNAPSTAVGFAEIQANITITGASDKPPQGTCNFSTPAGTCPYGAYSREPGNVSWHAARNITFSRNKFQHLGAAALVFEYGSQSNRIEGNVFTDVSGSGVQIGDTGDPHPSDVGADRRELSAYNTIANNVISEIGAEYHGAVGIAVFFAQHNTVRNNEIHAVPYTAISSGAVGGHADVPDSPDTTTSVDSDNTISNNVIYHYLTVLNDGGAIYTEGHQGDTLLGSDGTIDHAASYAHGLQVSGNIVYAQGGSGNAFYDDIGSQWLTWSGNVQWQAPSAQGGCLPVGHLSFVGNFHSDHLQDFGCGQPLDTTYKDDTLIPRSPTASDLPFPILAAAGLEPSFRDVAAALPPELEYANPNTGIALADTLVLIGGAGFGSDTRVGWDDRPAVSVETLSSNFITATAPAGAKLSLLRVTTGAGSVLLRINDTDPAIAYTGTWVAGQYPGNYGDDTQHTTQQDGDSFRYDFAGVGIDVISALDSNRGSVDVYVDGRFVQRDSCVAPSLLSQQVCVHVAGLTSGSHSLEIVKTGGTYLTLDALQVIAANP